MIAYLLAAFVTVPLIDLFLLIALADAIGLAETVVIVLATGVVGSLLARDQGLATVRKFRASVRMGRPPSTEIVEGALVLVGAALLVTPGLITDATGFVLLLPFTRSVVRRRLVEILRSRVRGGTGRVKRHP